MSTDTIPNDLGRPIEVYETQFLYLGFSRYDVQKKIVTRFETSEGGSIRYIETHVEPQKTFPKVYQSESVRVTVYSQSPRIWKEEVGPYDYTLFQQVTHVD